MVKQVDREEFARLFNARMANIERQIAKLQSDLEAMKRAEGILFQGSIQPSLLNDAPPFSTELEGVKPTTAIFMVLKGNPQKSWTASEMQREIKRRGHRPSTKNFPSVISSTLFRLAKHHRIERIEDDGMATRFKAKAEG